MKTSTVLGALFVALISLFLLFALSRPAHASVPRYLGPPIKCGNACPPGPNGPSFWQRLRGLPHWWK